MNALLLILPDFLVIALGAALAKLPAFSRFFAPAFWHAAERLVFYVLLPPMLFLSIAEAEIDPGSAADFVFAGVAAMLGGVAAAWAVRLFVKADPVTHASVFHCGFRYNAYIAFPLAAKLFGAEGTALLALLIAFWVPISNAIAVSALASAVSAHGRFGEPKGASAAAGNASCAPSAAARPPRLHPTLLAIAKNPLIIATLSGLAANAAGLHIPAPLEAMLSSLGRASLSMGLLCIGAGLSLGALKAEWKLAAAASVERLIAVPCIALAVLALPVFSGLPPAAAGIALLFAAMPTSQSCFVMTAAMGGNAAIVAGVIALQTLAAAATLPVWISVISRLAGL